MPANSDSNDLIRQPLAQPVAVRPILINPLLKAAPSASAVTVGSIEKLARGDSTNITLLNFGHFEYFATNDAAFHSALLSRDVLHFRVNGTSNVTEINLSHGQDVTQLQRVMWTYPSPTVGFMKNSMPACEVDLAAIKTIGNESGGSFLRSYPDAVRLYYLTPNLFNDLGSEVSNVYLSKNRASYTGAVWVVAYADIASGTAFISMFDATKGALLLSSTVTLSINLLVFMSLAFWGLNAKYIVLALMIVGLIAAIAALVAIISAAAAAATAAAAAAGVAGVAAVSGGAALAAAATTAGFWVAVGFAAAAAGSVLWILNCIVSESAGNAKAGWTAKWTANQAKLNLAQASWKAASTPAELTTALSNFTAALGEETQLVNDPDSGMDADTQKSIIENINTLSGQIGSIPGAQPAK